VKDPIPNHWQNGLGLKHFKLPNTEKFANEIISLPIYPELTIRQIEYVVDSIKEFYAKK